MDYQFIVDNLQYTGSLTSGKPLHINSANYILQGRFDDNGEEKSVEVGAPTGFNPPISYDTLVLNKDECGYKLAEAFGWYANLEARETEIIDSSKPKRFIPVDGASEGFQKRVRVISNLERLQRATGENPKGVKSSASRAEAEKVFLEEIKSGIRTDNGKLVVK